jgi:hypothetical protein
MHAAVHDHDDDAHDEGTAAHVVRYRTQEMDFMLPAGLADQTVNMFVTSTTGASEYTVVINRAPLEQGQGLEGYVDAQVATLRKSVARYDLKLRETIEVGGRPAISLESSWAQNNVPIEQRQVVVVHGRAVMMLTLTARDTIRPGWWRAFDDLLESIRFRDGAGERGRD